MNRSNASAVRSGDGQRPSGYFTAGDGPTVLMLHSSLASKSQWTALSARLASRYRTIAVDLCGYGDDAMPAERATFTLDHEVRHVERVLEALAPRGAPLHVVGHSYGGLVALRFAQRYATRIASLTVYEPVAFMLLDDEARQPVQTLADTLARHVQEGRMHDATRLFVDFWSGDGALGRLPLPAQAKLAARIAKVPLDFQAACRSPLDPRTIAVPTLLLAGTRSPDVTQRIASALVRLLPSARSAHLDAGHMGPVTHGALVDPLIEAFVDARALYERTRIAARATMAPRAWSALAF